ncbi:MAG: ATP-dependent acyl-CoA ligase [Deltaproteobacteria bacterium]|nr:ATP-dependent acyl-CoA ligase [Deltaproteobacteria bacterium]
MSWANLEDVGEFCIRPTEPHVIFNGYFQNPEATLGAFRNLWYHTGDLGRCDGEGNYFFADRKADFIRFGGRNISSFTVEAAVNAHPALKQSAAHGGDFGAIGVRGRIEGGGGPPSGETGFT